MCTLGSKASVSQSRGGRIVTAVAVLLCSRGLLMLGAAVDLYELLPEEGQLIKALRSIPKDKSFSISFAFPEPIQAWHTAVMDEFWQHLEETTGARVHFSAVDTCALCGPLTSIHSAHMLIIQKSRSMFVQQARDIIDDHTKGKGRLETGNGLEHHEYTFPQRYGAVARGNGKGNGKGKGKGKGKVKGQGKCKR